MSLEKYTNSTRNSGENTIFSVKIDSTRFRIMTESYGNHDQFEISDSNPEARHVSDIVISPGLNVIFGQSRSGKTSLVNEILRQVNKSDDLGKICFIKMDEFDDSELEHLCVYESSKRFNLLNSLKLMRIAGIDPAKMIVVDSIKNMLYAGEDVLNEGNRGSFRKGGISNGFIYSINELHTTAKLMGVYLICCLSPSSIDTGETLQVLSTIVGATDNIICCVKPGVLFRDAPEEGLRMSNKFLRKIYL